MRGQDTEAGRETEVQRCKMGACSKPLPSWNNSPSRILPHYPVLKPKQGLLQQAEFSDWAGSQHHSLIIQEAFLEEGPWKENRKHRQWARAEQFLSYHL